MRRPHVARFVGVVAFCALLTVGCSGSDPTPTATPTATAVATLSPTPTDTSPSATPQTETPVPSAEPPLTDDDPVDPVPFPADLAPDTADASAGALLSPVNLRFGVQEGFDRVVLDLEGTGQPGWFSRYVDEPTADGSGAPVELAGEAYLQTAVKGVIYPTEAGAKEFVGPQRFQPDSAGVVEEVVYGSVFEGQVDVFIGLSSKQPFRVFLLENPTRIVIDIYHP